MTIENTTGTAEWDETATDGVAAMSDQPMSEDEARQMFLREPYTYLHRRSFFRVSVVQAQSSVRTEDADGSVRIDVTDVKSTILNEWTVSTPQGAAGLIVALLEHKALFLRYSGLSCIVLEINQDGERATRTYHFDTTCQPNGIFEGICYALDEVRGLLLRYNRNTPVTVTLGDALAVNGPLIGKWITEASFRSR